MTVATSGVDLGLGGDFPVDPSLLGCEQEPAWFSSGRAALAAIVNSRLASRKGATAGTWLVPDFICRVVPSTLQACGAIVEPYSWRTPWSVDEESLVRSLPRAAGVVVPFYMGLPPAPEIWTVLDVRPVCIVEDRCQYVGMPPGPAELRGEYAIGSFRKWLGVPDGAYCVRRNGPAPRPVDEENGMMVGMRLAAALIKHVRRLGLEEELDRLLETIGVELFRRGELAAETASTEWRASRFSQSILRCVDFAGIASRRIRNQRWLAEQLAERDSLEIWEPTVGAVVQSTVPLLALPVLSAKRDDLRRRLKDARVFCAVHWSDGNWTDGTGPAADWAARALSLPIDQRYEIDDLLRILEAIT